MFLVTQAVILATIFLSITVITGMAGQISLCQGAFAAIGAFTVFQLVDRYDMAVLPAALIGAVIAAAVGALLSLPIRRLGGIWIAIATLAFAYFFDSVVVKLPFVGGGDVAAAGHGRAPTGHRPVRLRQRQVVPRARGRSCWSWSPWWSSNLQAGHAGPDAAGVAGQRGRRPVDRHLAGPGPAVAFADLGVHRRRSAAHCWRCSRRTSTTAATSRRSSRCSGWWSS